MQYNSTKELLDGIRRRHKLRSDYALCKRMGWTSSRVGNYRSGRSFPDDDACARIAQELGLRDEHVIAIVNMDRAGRQQNAQRRDLWRVVARSFHTSQVVIACAILAGLSVQDAQAAAPGPIVSMVTQSIDYAHYRLRRVLAGAAGALKRFARCLDAGAITPLSVSFQQ